MERELKELLEATKFLNFGFEDIITPKLIMYYENLKFEKNDIYIGKIKIRENKEVLLCSHWSFPFKEGTPKTLLKYKDFILKDEDKLIELSGKRLICNCGNITECHGNLLIMIFNSYYKNDI